MKKLSMKSGFKYAAVAYLLLLLWGMYEWQLGGEDAGLVPVLTSGIGLLGFTACAVHGWPDAMMKVMTCTIGLGLAFAFGGSLIWYHCLLLDYVFDTHVYTNASRVLTSLGTVLLVVGIGLFVLLHRH